MKRDQIIRVLAEDAQEAVGSMGDDTPMAVLSQQVRSPFDYLRQQFAQVTNPPIDPIREAVVMSLNTCFGPERSMFQESPEHASAWKCARRCCPTRSSPLWCRRLNRNSAPRALT